MGNDKLWKANQALRNEIKESKNNDLSKNQRINTCQLDHLTSVCYLFLVAICKAF